MCAARCPAELSPYNIALFVRRLYGAHKLPKSPQLEKRVSDITQGVFNAGIAELKKTDNKKLQTIFNDMQAKKGASV
jgi:RNA polymerase-interacting CarD/CdnL/TRCF family regulator